MIPMPPAIRLSDTLSIPDEEIDLCFVRASGPGGQNVNKVATAAQLRFNVTDSPSLGPAIKERLRRIAGQRLTREGVLLIKANRFRTQERNREDAIERLVDLVRAALVAPTPRKKTKVPLGSRRRRLESKQQRSRVKSSRSRHRLLAEP